MVENANPEPNGPYDALSASNADFERVRQLTLERAEVWLVANDATVARDADYDAVFLFHDRCYHSQLAVVRARGQRRFEAVLRFRINTRFQIVQGPVVSEWREQRAADDAAREYEVEQGTIVCILDGATVTQVFIDTGADVVVLAADGNLLRRAEADSGSLVGMRVEFERTDWPGGLKWFARLDDQPAGLITGQEQGMTERPPQPPITNDAGDVLCPNCRRFIPAEYDPDSCIFGRHPKRRK